ncbi:diphthine--ammonia ligase [Sediminibacterium sp.]|uniref:Dph6-related ATP pyrophosphatase n=1 Tax=Sediminibacterium sp. TaxID=1917865 RepID=UPI002730EFDE|nr:diphthine--ammonia ligase [Sediminibacterium sp.]MDP2421478.1 diphthine--ammonia ligase [Sediminibacterium sp.]
MKKIKAVFCWSGGKDSSLALYQVLQENTYQVVSLLTTLNAIHKRISMHGVREELLDMQAASIGLPLEKVWVSEASNEEYENNMELVLIGFKNEGVTHVIFGDIFLEDLREYREQKLSAVGLTGVFPLWKQDTRKLVSRFITQGFKTLTCCISTKWLDESFVGQEINQDFISRLPAGVDPCGENGEFHSFCYDGPLFKQSIEFEKGDKVFRKMNSPDSENKSGFWFIDLLPANK